MLFRSLVRNSRVSLTSPTILEILIRAPEAHCDNDEQVRYPHRDDDIHYPDDGIYAESG